MSNTTIRIRTETHELLQHMAKQSGTSMQAVLERALEAERRRRLLDAANLAYAALQADGDAASRYRQELDIWDATLEDGLEED